MQAHARGCEGKAQKYLVKDLAQGLDRSPTTQPTCKANHQLRTKKHGTDHIFFRARREATGPSGKRGSFPSKVTAQARRAFAALADPDVAQALRNWRLGFTVLSSCLVCAFFFFVFVVVCFGFKGSVLGWFCSFFVFGLLVVGSVDF